MTCDLAGQQENHYEKPHAGRGQVNNAKEHYEKSKTQEGRV
jgi:hypothetical protein